MKDLSRLQPEDFENLLKWLSDDREQAAEAFIQIREGLIKYFRFKGCSDPLALTDETVNRVAEKVLTLHNSEKVKKITIFYGFAANILLEYLRQRKYESEKLNAFSQNQEKFQLLSDSSESPEITCLHKCLDGLSPEDKEVFLKYYSFEKENKAEARRAIARDLGCEMSALHVRVFRLREHLRKCINKCLKKSL